MSADIDCCNGENMRTRDKMEKCRKAKGIDKLKGCLNVPLIQVEPKDCVIDELHLFLRISDVLSTRTFVSFFSGINHIHLQSPLHMDTLLLHRITGHPTHLPKKYLNHVSDCSGSGCFHKKW